jgi:hypothetical protein
MSAAESNGRLPLARLVLVGIVVPTISVAVDHVLLAAAAASPTQNGGLLILALAALIVQVGLFGVLCGRLPVPVFRWVLYGWCWVLVDLQTLVAGANAGPSYYWGNSHRLLPSALFNAQLGLMTIWAVFGTARWYVRVPAAAILGLLCAIPQLDVYYQGSDLSGLLFMQMAILGLICLTLRFRGFRLVDQASVATAAGGLRPLQFGVRHVLIWTTSLAVLLGAARGLNMLSPDFLSSLLGTRWIVNVTTGCLLAIVLVVALWAALGAGGASRLVALVFVPPLAGLLISAGQWYSSVTRWRAPPVLSAAFWSGWWSDEWWLVVWTCLAGGLLFAALLIYRTLGYRLTRQP